MQQLYIRPVVTTHFPPRLSHIPPRSWPYFDNLTCHIQHCIHSYCRLHFSIQKSHQKLTSESRKFLLLRTVLPNTQDYMWSATTVGPYRIRIHSTIKTMKYRYASLVHNYASYRVPRGKNLTYLHWTMVRGNSWKLRSMRHCRHQNKNLLNIFNQPLPWNERRRVISVPQSKGWWDSIVSWWHHCSSLLWWIYLWKTHAHTSIEKKNKIGNSHSAVEIINALRSIYHSAVVAINHWSRVPPSFGMGKTFLLEFRIYTHQFCVHATADRTTK